MLFSLLQPLAVALLALLLAASPAGGSRPHPPVVSPPHAPASAPVRGAGSRRPALAPPRSEATSPPDAPLTDTAPEEPPASVPSTLVRAIRTATVRSGPLGPAGAGLLILAIGGVGLVRRVRNRMRR